MLYKNFIDKINIICRSGNGGHGCVHFFKKNKKIGKPDGGNGGKGGNIIIIGNKNLFTLYNLKFKKLYKAYNGENGKSKCKTGKKGKDIIINVPFNTIISYKYKNKNKKFIIKENYRKKILLYGGKGGKGNFFFKNSFYPKSKKYSLGEKGKNIFVKFKLKIKIDIALIGYPNTGKSTILSKLTNSKPKIGNYNYTTIIPNIGVYNIYYKNFLIMDIPAIGMGNKFIKYLKYSNIILIVMFIDNIKNFLKDYNKINKIINLYKKKKFKKIIILSKYDNINKKKILRLINFFKNNKINYCLFSKKKIKSLNKLKLILNKFLCY